MSNFSGTEIEIWDGFGPVGNTEKKIRDDYEPLLRSVFPKPAQISISVP